MLLASLAFMGAQAGCILIWEELEDRFEDHVIEEVRQQAAPGAPDDEVEIYEPSIEPTISINSIQPNRGSAAGGDAVEIIGLGFEPCLQVLFGAERSSCEQRQVLDSTTILCVTPPHGSAEDVAVRVVRPADCGTPETAVLPSAFSYFNPVNLVEVQPARGPSTGGTLVAIIGSGFIAGTTVRFGTSGTLTATVIDDGALSVRTPAMPAGIYPVMVTNINGSATLGESFTSYDTLSLSRIEPFTGPLSGGISLRIFGTGFESATDFTIADSPIENPTTVPSNEMSGILPPGDSEGPVTVRARGSSGEATLDNGFVYIDDSDQTPRIITIEPSTGTVDGGDSVAVVVVGTGTNETGDTAEVTFGGISADCQPRGDFTLMCQTPAHGVGAFDVTVTSGDTQLTSISGFEFIDLQLESMRPNAGAIAGGTLVSFTGSGFSADTQVFFGATLARDIGVSEDGQTLSVRTPATDGPGPVDVVVSNRGVAKTLSGDNGFTYFDPANGPFWTDLGPVDGEINLTVFDADNSERIANAFVMVGASFDLDLPHLFGFTDAAGQLTLAGPELVGPLSVHIAKSGYSNFSWIDVNARDLKVILSAKPPPPPDPLPECPQPAGGGPVIIRGDVLRIKDAYNTGFDTVKLTTTMLDPSIPLPDPGPFSTITSNGRYELVARSGDMVLIALAGSEDGEENQPRFTTNTMGFRPFLFTEPSSALPCLDDRHCETPGETCEAVSGATLCMRVYDDVDIVVDTPLDSPLEVILDNPPLGTGVEIGLPTHSVVSITWDFGYMGSHPMGQTILAGATTLSVPMPSKMPQALSDSSFELTGGVYFYAGSLLSPQSEVTLSGLRDTSEPIVLSPFLKTHRSLSPAFGETIEGDSISFEVALLPEDQPEVIPTANMHWLYDFEIVTPCEGAMPMPRPIIRWIVLTAGPTVQFDLPVFPNLAGNTNLPPDIIYYWQLMSFISLGTSYERLDLDGLFAWHSRALFVSAVDLNKPRQRPSP